MMRQWIDPVLRGAGFTGSALTWCLRSSGGDFAVVNLQRSRWNTADEVSFEVNLAVVPEPWWRFRARHVLDKAPKTPREHDGLLRRRHHPERRYAGWSHPRLGRQGWVVQDAASADVCATVLSDELVTVVLPELVTLNDRGALIAGIAAGIPDWHLSLPRKVAIAFLMVDEGASPQIREAINIVRSLRDGQVEARNALLDWLTHAQQPATTNVPRSIPDASPQP